MNTGNIINGLLRNFQKPDGFWGRIILWGMNNQHSSLSQWTMSHIGWQEEWSVLDIGCGGGANLAQMLRYCPRGKVYGVDISSESVIFARKRNKKYLSTRCFVEQGTVDKLPYEDEMFDAVTAFETVYFWDNLSLAFTEVARVLKKEGYFLICCEKSDPLNKTWPKLIKGMVIRSGNELKSVLDRSGFGSVTLYQGRKGVLCIVAQKKSS